MEWIINNKEWIFSGVGVVVIAAIIRYFWSLNKKQKANTDGSINQSIGTNITATMSSVKIEKNRQEVNLDPNKSKK